MLRPGWSRGVALSGVVMLLAVMTGCAKVPLEGTNWTLTTLRDPSVLTPGYIFLDPKERRVSGSGGCNSLNGSYELDGDRLTFGPLATTRMACREDHMDAEQAFHEAMARVSRWKIEGKHLELFDEAGVMVARFDVWHPK